MYSAKKERAILQKKMGVNRKFEKKIESLRKKKMAKQTFEENTHITS